MATAGSKQAYCSIVKASTLELETKADRGPNYSGVVMMDDKLIVIDYEKRGIDNESNLKVYNRHDGKLITSHRLEDYPTDVCLISKTEVAVCLVDGRIEIVSLKSIDDVKLVKTLETGFDYCFSLAKWNSELVVSGLNDGMLCWGILSITDGHLDSTHYICKGLRTRMAVKDNTVYISCRTDDSITQGVYAYYIFKPHTQKFLYQHQELITPGSILADRECGYVCDSNRIHQLTDRGQLVTIHTVSSRLDGIFYDDKQGLLYTTSLGSNVITVYKMESLQKPGVPIEILKMDDRSIQLFEEALKDGKETVHNIRIMVIGHMGVGKTTLVKRLLGEEVNISERYSTEGIDVYVNCCDVSLSTHEWTRRTKDSEQDYKLQRLVKVLNENYQTGGREVDLEPNASSNQRETTDGNPLHHVADNDKTTEVLYYRSQQQNVGQNISSSSSLQKKSSSNVVQRSLNPSETNTMPGSELGKNVATANYKMDPLRDMLKLLQQNPNKAKQDISKHAHLTMLDFAGQYAFYTTHQMFLTRRAIYLLVSDASRGVSDLVEDEFYFDSQGTVKSKVHDLVQVWMNSIHSCAPPDTENLNSANSHTSSCKVLLPPVILVGTHIDQIPQNLPTMVDNYGGQIVMPGSSGSSNPGPRSPLQDNVQTQGKWLSLFGYFVRRFRSIFSSGGNNPDPRKPLQSQQNLPTMVDNYGGQIVMPGLSGSSNPGPRSPLQDNVQTQRNLPTMVDNYGGQIVMPGSSGSSNPGPRSPLQDEVQSQMNLPTMVDNYGGQVVMPGFSGSSSPGPRGPIQDDVHSQMNLPTMVSNYGGQIVRPGFTVSSNLGPRGPIQDDVQAQKDYRRERGQRYLKEIRSYLRDKPAAVHLVDEDFAIDNSTLDSKLEELKKKIVEVASQQPYWGEQIPTRWFLLEQQLMMLRDAGWKVISRSTVEELNQKGNVQIKKSEELDLFLKYLHETGTIIYFSIEVLRENIVLAPKWLIDALKLLINAQPNLPNSPAENSSQSVGSTHIMSDRAVTQKWLDFKEKGILTLELVDAVWTHERYPELHAHRDHILRIMEQLNIIAKPRAFTETGEKVENYFLAPCMLHQKTPGVVTSPEQDPHVVSTLELCCVFTGKFLPPPIFHRLLAACIAQWPVAQNRKTKENLIFCGGCVFNIDLFHRLTLYYKNHVVYARITRMVVDEVKTPDAKLCSRVRSFITQNLSKIISYLGQNLQYVLRIQSPPSQGVPEARIFGIWFEDEGHDPDASITREHMNHARLCIALQSVFGKALRDILIANFPVQYNDIYQTILANQVNLTRRQGRPLLNQDQCKLVFPDPHGRTTGTVDQFDLSLLYTLIRNISTVSAPITGWGTDPQDQPRDCSLGASVERIRLYRNHITGHSPDGKINQNDFEDYWKKFEVVIHDIESLAGGQVYSQELGRQKRQVISIYEAC